MFCTYCKAARPDTEVPCPNCGAPSPLLGSQNSSWGAGGAGNPGAMSWGNTAAPGAPGTSFRDQWEQQQVPQPSFDNAFAANKSSWQPPSGQLGFAQPWQQPSGQLGAAQSWQQQDFDQVPMPSWQQPSEQLSPSQSWQQPGAQDQQKSGPQSLLPVPYEGGTALEPVGRQSTISLQLVPEQAISHLLPAEPLPVPDIVHVAPMYTKPRPIIPKRRIINGLLSVIIVTLLLCSGAGYYAKASGIWDSAVRMYTGEAPLSNVTQPNVTIPDPPASKSGPAQQFIPSVATATRLNQDKQIIEKQNIFTPGQTFYLTFSVQPTQGQTGTVTAKWYTNDHFYIAKNSDPVKYDPTKIDYIVMDMRIDQPASGRVELYWNGQLAQTYYFAVRS
jgi:hypothetical protein